MLKFLFFILSFGILIPSLTVAQSAAINTDGSNADVSAMLDVKSTNKGMLVPRMSTLQRTGIASPAKGLLVFDNDTGDFWFYNGAAWVSLTSGESTNVWKKNADTVYTTNKGSVGIGINNSLLAKLHLQDTASNGSTSFLVAGKSSNPGISIFNQERTNFSSANLGFNTYYGLFNSNRQYLRISDGYASNFEYDAKDGELTYRNSFESGSANTSYSVVSGAFKINKYGHVSINSFSVAGLNNFEVAGISRLATVRASRIGIGIDVVSPYNLDVDGGPVRFRDNARIDGTLNPNNTLVVGQDLLVNTNKGIVRSNNSSQLKIVRWQLSFTLTSLPVGSYVETGFFDYENFGGTPQVFVGNIFSFSTQDWTKLLITPFEVSSTGCKFRIFNAGTSAAAGNFVYQIMTMGPQ